MESCVKNCGSLVHGEIATKQFMEELRDLVKQTNDENIKKKVLEMIQHWGMAFRNSPKYRIVTVRSRGKCTKYSIITIHSMEAIQCKIR